MAAKKKNQPIAKRPDRNYEAAGDVAFMCTPELHLIDRRSLVTIPDPNNGRNVLRDQLNSRCACGKVSSDAAEYRGGAFAFVYLPSGQVEEEAFDSQIA